MKKLQPVCQIKKQFRRTHIVGRRFPICHVTIQDTTVDVGNFLAAHLVSLVEDQTLLGHFTCFLCKVASFETKSKIVKKTEDFHLSQIPCNYDQTTFLLWRSSMRRDFTINRYFYK